MTKLVEAAFDRALGTHVLGEAIVAQQKQYDFKSEYTSEQAAMAHIELYNASVKSFNKASAEMDALNAKRDLDAFRMAKRAEITCMDDVYMHELFFANCWNVNSELFANSLAFIRLQRDWGTFDNWQLEFVQCALAPTAGYAVTAFNVFAMRYVNFFVERSSSSSPLGCVPVIVLDVCEHAFARDFACDRRSYVVGMMKEFNWDVIEDRFKRTEKIYEALK